MPEIFHEPPPMPDNLRSGKPLVNYNELPEEVNNAVTYLRHDLTQAHGEDHIVDADELRVLLDWVSPRG